MNAKATSTSTDPISKWTEEMKNLFEKYKMPGLDLDALSDWQRKDIEALTEANRTATEGMSALVKRRTEILEEALSQWQSAVKDATGADALAKQTEIAQEGFNKALANYRELAEMEVKTYSDAWKVVQDRMQENMTNLQKMLQPK
ncbi:TIGR01841 family phasin [Seohaeicola saemankumensis]|nr:TIGR01841 family phasin [Seohaeicola saemankumensis]MCA0871094.1 TIGR01841 family phasin [Seohaeicola saemankumensis]